MSNKIIPLIACFLFLYQIAQAKTVNVSGILEPLRDADISASVAGKIDKIHYREGQFVEKGTTVIQIEDLLERLEVDRRRVIFKDKAELKAAIARVKMARTELDSTEALFQRTGSISQEEFGKKILEHKLAVAEKDRQENEEARESLELVMAEFQLEQRAIEAPFAGFVADVYLEEGEACSPGKALFRLVDPTQCYFSCNIESSLAAYLEEEQIVNLSIMVGYESVTKKGKIEFIAPTIDPASGLRKVRVLIDNSDFLLTPGATGVLNIETTLLK